MTEGEKLRNYLKSKGIGPTEAANILGKGDRQSIYGYFKTDRFRDELLAELKEKLGFEPETEPEEYSIPRDQPDIAIAEYENISKRIKLLKAEILSLEDRKKYIREAFPEIGGFSALD